MSGSRTSKCVYSRTPREDTRAVSPVIGFILIFSILIIGVSVYQVEVVPQDNHQTEFEHNQQLQNELLNLRDATHNTGQDNISRSVTVTPGTQYDSRTLARNPLPPAGTISTVELDENVTVIDENGTEIANRTSNAIVYTPDYNEYHDAPTTRIEHTLIYNDFEADNENVTRSGQRLIEPDRVVVPIVEGDLSESDVDRVSIRTTWVEQETHSTDNVTVTLSTENPDRWENEFEEAVENGPIENVISHESDGLVEFEANVSKVTIYRVQL